MLNPTRDTYVDQHTPSTNYLNDEYMQVNFTDNETRSDRYGRYAYMDFDISDIDKETLSTAKLWVYVDANSDVRNSTRTIGVFAPASTWSDSMTWSSGRVAVTGDAIGTYTVTGNSYDITDYGWKCIDITDYVKSVSSDTLSLMMQSINSNAHPVLIRSNEYSDENTRPRLVVTHDLLPIANMEWDSLETVMEHLEEEPEFELSSKEELSSSVDLTSKFPPPHAKGQQGQNNCAVWAVVYNLKSGQENMAHNWGFDTDEHLFSPSYVYNQLNQEKNDNVSIGAVMGLVVDQGVCSLKSFPYIKNDWITQPTEEQKKEAAKFKSIEWNSIKGVDNIKCHLANGDGVVIGINVLPQFDYLNARPLSDTSGSIQVFNDASGTSRGSHALCLIGYDDELGAFKFINSWNAAYGYQGYGWISYDMLTDTRVNFYGEAYGFILKSHYEINAKVVKMDATETSAGGTVMGSGLYDPNETVTLTAIPDTGYDFIGWYNESDEEISVENTLTFQATDDRTLEARFKLKATGAGEPVFVDVTVGTGGTVTGDGIYSYGDTVTLTAVANEGYTFDGWYENGIKIDDASAIYSFIAEESRVLEARFGQV